ncbi:MAG TPA: hypothetical protein VIM24_12425, partial [Candidatus Limnocylindrales bacterium]
MALHINRPARIGTALLAAGSLLFSLAAATGTSAAKIPPAPIPTHVYSPYFETWTTDSIAATASASGVRYFTLAFLESTSKTSCTLAWDGVAADAVANGKYLSDIASLRSGGGDVVLSFGGWSADQSGTEIGDSCGNVSAI